MTKINEVIYLEDLEGFGNKADKESSCKAKIIIKSGGGEGWGGE